jgi:hypothetical protein
MATTQYEGHVMLVNFVVVLCGLLVMLVMTQLYRFTHDSDKSPTANGFVGWTYS